MGILAGFRGILGVFKTSSNSGFGLHSFGVIACAGDPPGDSTTSVASEAKVGSSAVVVVVRVGCEGLWGRASIILQISSNSAFPWAQSPATSFMSS